MNNCDRPAMPTRITSNQSINESKSDVIGLTKREFFAMHAMQANRSRNTTYESWEDLAKDSVEIADALLAELDKAND